MALEKYISTQASVLLAGVLIAAGLFFGLRGREPAPSPTLPKESLVSSSGANIVHTTPPSQAPAPPLIPPLQPAAEVDRAAIVAAATKELERHRAEVVKKCVKPALEKQPEPKHIKLSINITFDAQGQQIMRGALEDRETMREGVSMCAMGLVPPLKLPMAPGASVGIEIPWVLP